MVFKRLFSFSQRVAGFRYAFRGLAAFLRSEPHAWIHLSATLLVIAGICLLPVQAWETAALLVCTGMVWAAEIFNSCIEKTMDLLHPGRHPKVMVIKDMAAAAVLVLSITALIIGLCIFIPKLVSV